MIKLSKPRAITAAAVTAAAIAAATAGCTPQDSLASSSKPAALSATQSVSWRTAPTATHHAWRHHERTPSPSASPTTSTPAPASSSPAPASSSPAPAPTPTQTSPSPVPTSTSTSYSCTTSAAKGSCGPYTYPQMQGTTSAPTVNNDVWAPISGWQQTLHANNPGDWSVTANMPAGNTAVVSYPSNEANYNERSLSSFSKLVSSFSENMHATSSTSAWAAYDIWTNNWANEIMIQHDFANNGPCSFVATADFGGSNGVPVQKWGLCTYGSELIWKLTSGSEQTGSVDVLAMLTWLENHGYLPSNSNLTAIGYGFELCSTGGANENFQVNGYSISES